MPGAEEVKAKLADTKAWTDEEHVDEERRNYYHQLMDNSLYQNLTAKRYDPDTKVVSLIPDPDSEKMFKSVFPDTEICSYSYTY